MISKRLLLAAIFLAALCSEGVAQRRDDMALEALMRHKASDGATIEEVLNYAERMRPGKFKVARIYSANGFTSDHRLVVIEHWIGQKRFEGDKYNFLNFEVTESGKVSIPRDNLVWKHQLPLLQGRDAFLLMIDEQYRDACTSAKSIEPLC